MKTIGVRINQSKLNPEIELERYIIKRVQLGLSKDKTAAIKDALYVAMNYDKLEQEKLKLQEDLKKRDQQIEILYNVIEKLKGQPVYVQSEPIIKSNQNDIEDFNLDIDLSDSELSIVNNNDDLTDEELVDKLLEKFIG